MEKKKTIFIEMKCYKCKKNIGMGILNETFWSDCDSFIPDINQITYNKNTNLKFYCNKCYVKEVFNIDL